MATPSRYPGELEQKAEPSLTCPRCGATSYNLNDLNLGYCGQCHVFLDDEARLILGSEDDSARQLGFIYARSLPDGRFVGVEPTVWGGGTLKISSDRDPHGSCDDLWQYKDAGFALNAAATWDPAKDKEPFGWFRHPPTGRRRPFGNPKNEYVRP